LAAAAVSCGSDAGYQFSPDWSVMATLDHVSNGTGFLSDCHLNQRVTAVGLRLGRFSEAALFGARL
jgi:hypothetical protein